MSGWKGSPSVSFWLTLPAWSFRLWSRVGVPSRARSAPVRLWTCAGTLSRSMPVPGRGVVPITSTVGKVSTGGVAVCAMPPPGASARTAATGASHARVRSRIFPLSQYSFFFVFRLERNGLALARAALPNGARNLPDLWFVPRGLAFGRRYRVQSTERRVTVAASIPRMRELSVMRMMVVAVVLIVAAGAALGAERMRFWNLTAATITKLYLAPAGSDKWGSDQCQN